MKEMSLIFRITLAVELAMVLSEDNERERTSQGMNASGKAARTSGKTRQVSAEFRADPLHTKTFALVRHGRMYANGVDRVAIRRRQVAVVPNGCR